MPRTLTELGPLARTATKEQAADHDRQTTELARYKLGRITANDADGYHRVACPAAMGKIRCPLRPSSMRQDRNRPEILTPPEHPQACCTQQTITVPADVNAKTRQKHDYPSAAWRRSHARRTGAERGFATTKDPATNDITRGWDKRAGDLHLVIYIWRRQVIDSSELPGMISSDHAGLPAVTSGLSVVASRRPCAKPRIALVLGRSHP